DAVPRSRRPGALLGSDPRAARRDSIRSGLGRGPGDDAGAGHRVPAERAGPRRRRVKSEVGSMAPPVKYAKSGDVHIAYQVIGDAPVDLVLAPGAVSHLDLWWESHYWARLFERMGSFSRLILFDKRGTGLSDRPVTVATLEERIDDIRAVMD